MEEAFNAFLVERERNEHLTEREKMLKGDHFLPYTPALMADREKCLAACWNFNRSSDPSTGNSPAERSRFFKAIMMLKPSPEPEPAKGEQPKKAIDPEGVPEGKVGDGVVVEAPFFCDYGYNIQIGNNVLIGPDCRISDVCAVKIGDDVILSTGVKIVTSTHPIDPKQRMAGKGVSLGRSVIIDKGCWIGTDVTITPGVKINKYAVIAAGSLVCKVPSPSSFPSNDRLTIPFRMSLHTPSSPEIPKESFEESGIPGNLRRIRVTDTETRVKNDQRDRSNFQIAVALQLAPIREVKVRSRVKNPVEKKCRCDYHGGRRSDQAAAFFFRIQNTLCANAPTLHATNEEKK